MSSNGLTRRQTLAVAGGIGLAASLPGERAHAATEEFKIGSVLELENHIQNQVQKEVDRSQRDFFLREQLKAIQTELGQEDPLTREITDIHERIQTAGLPP